MNLEEKIKEWVATDNQVKLYQQKIKELKGFRGDISTEILDFVETNHLDNTTIRISDGKLRFQNNRITTPLTFKFIKKCLSECIENDRQVDQIIEYIKESREIRYVPDIKRYYSKTN